jgi:uncharacterized protein (TIGR03435 family)
VRKTIRIILLAPAILTALHGQTSAKAEFEAASIKTLGPQTGFHFAADAVSGGPGTTDPGMFRCNKCSLATLIIKAFNLQPYQFPGRTSFTENTYDIQAKIAPGATEEEFSAMLQNLLKDRFGLTWHFQEKKMKGYRLMVAKNGPKLIASDASLPRADQPRADQHAAGPAEAHSHSGVIAFGSSATYRAASQTIADLARVLSDQIGVPVDDGTGLAGKFDISLRWSGTTAAHAGNHSDGAFSGGSGHAGHDGGGGAPSADPSGPTLFDALQQELGLRLVPAEEALTRLFVVDRVAQRPTEN